jgi:hypothetical protein
MKLSLGVVFLFICFSAMAGNYSVDQILQVAKTGNSNVLILGSTRGCFTSNNVKRILRAGVEVSLDNCNYDFPSIIEFSRIGSLKITTNRNAGCFTIEQVKSLLSAGIEITFNTCHFNLITMVELAKLGKMRVIANDFSGWPITDLEQMSLAGIEIIFP